MRHSRHIGGDKAESERDAKKKRQRHDGEGFALPRSFYAATEKPPHEQPVDESDADTEGRSTPPNPTRGGVHHYLSSSRVNKRSCTSSRPTGAPRASTTGT